MAAPRKPSSNSGRASTDWQHAFQFYAALPPDLRDYKSVASEFRVSVRTVERHGLRERWRERAHEIDAAAARAAAATLATERAAKLVDVDRLIDATRLSYAQQLRDGRVPIRPADLPRLHKLRKEIWQEPDPEPTPELAPSAGPEDSFDHQLKVLKALRDAGALDRLQDLTPESAESDTP